MFRDSVCEFCKHFQKPAVGKYPTCAAFPLEIPIEITRGLDNHMTPFEGDHGIMYEVSAEAKKLGFDMRKEYAPQAA
jgi:hypothetical protein